MGMISALRGKIWKKEDDRVTIDVQGVGYEILMAAPHIYDLGETGRDVELDIHTHVNESSFVLFGFLKAAQKALFKKFLSVSGVGPKLALTMIAAMPAADLIQAIVMQDINTLKSISGVGPKTAQRIAMELKDKLADFDTAAVGSVSGGIPDVQGVHGEVVQALVSLGYGEAHARKALQKIAIAPEDSTQVLIKKSLGVLSS